MFVGQIIVLSFMVTKVLFMDEDGNNINLSNFTRQSIQTLTHLTIPFTLRQTKRPFMFLGQYLFVTDFNQNNLT